MMRGIEQLKLSRRAGVNDMKYPEEMYLNSGFYDGDMDDSVENHKEKIVKCRKDHKCSACQNTIKKGDQALYESGFMDGAPVSCYTCLKCIEDWLEESGQIELED